MIAQDTTVAKQHARGRRPGRNATRARILAAAGRQFAAHGYERSSLRSIARAAGVDQRLLRHFFGTKRGLFLAAMALPLDPAAFVAAISAPGLAGFGERLAGAWVELWDSPDGRHLVGLVRAAATDEGAARLLREVFAHVVLRQLVRSLRPDRVERRATLVATQLFGLVLVRYVLRLPPVATMTPSEVASWMGPTIQRYLEQNV